MARTVNLDEWTVPELTALIQDAEAKRDEKMEGARQSLREEMETRAAELGLSIEGLLGSRATSPRASQNSSRRGATRKSGGTVAAKYRGPNGEEWTGRGRPPKWLAELEGKGGKREDHLING